MTRNVEHMDLPDSDWSENAPGETIAGGETHAPDETVRLNGPPGTGKTTEIAKRLAYLIEEENVDPEMITLVTYRRSLADAVESRLTEWGVLTGEEDLEFWTTIHAAANRATGVLAEAASKQSDDQRLGPAVAEQEKVAFCRGELGVSFFPGNLWEDTRGQLLMDLFSYCRANLLDPTDRSDARQAPMFDSLKDEWPGVDIESQFETFEVWKDQKNLHEFNALLEAGIDGRLPPTDVVVVDEYHDATPLMARLSERWFDASDTTIVAGDPLQVVNEFRGADPRFFTERLDHIPEILLDTTYRVPEEHWQAATRMLEAELDAPPVTRDGRGQLVEYQSPKFEHSDENGWTVPSETRPGSPGAIHSEYIDGEDDRSVMYLTRTRMQAIGVSAALDKAGIPHSGQEDVSGWDERRRVLFNSIRKLRSVSPAFRSDTTTYGLDKYQSDGDGDDDSGVTMHLSSSEAAAVLDHSSARLMSVSREEAIEAAEDMREEEAAVSVDELDDLVSSEWWRTYCRGIDSVPELIKNGELDDDAIESLQRTLQRRDEHIGEDDLKDVRVLTCHASKGSEASDVVVYDGITNRIVNEMERSESTRENEARTWYVAITRASSRMHVVRGGFEWMVPHLPENLCRVAADAAAETTGGEASGD